MKAIKLLASAIALLFVNIKCILIELTGKSKTEDLMDDSKVVLFLALDTRSTDFSDYLKIYSEVESDLKDYNFQFFYFDARKDPQFEDSRLPFAINHFHNAPTNSYIIAIDEGRLRNLEFVIDSDESMHQQDVQKLKSILIDFFVRPVKSSDCNSVQLLADSEVMLVNFGKTVIQDFEELARREFMMHGYKEMIQFYHISDMDCALKIGIKAQQSVVLFQPGEQPLENNKKLDQKSLSKWIACVRSDVQRKFTARVVSTSENQEIHALILVTTNEENKSELQNSLKTAFDTFTTKIKFKQDRVLFYHATPADKPVGVFPAVSMAKFYGVDFNKVKLPAIMLAKAGSANIEFYENVESVTEDDLAGWIFDKVFIDLATKKSAAPKFRPQNERKMSNDDL